jgi:integrase
MPAKKLTDRSIGALPVPAVGQVDYFDQGLPGFGLRVTANGVRAWTLLYRHHGRKRRMTLGTYPVVSLATARARAKELLADVVKGGDPAGAKRAEREAGTFADLVHAYLNKYAKPRKRSWQEDERILLKYVPRSWRSRPASMIARREVRDLVESIAERAPIMANRVLACLRKVFNYAIQRELIAANPCTLIERPAPERQRDRVLSADELRRIWAALQGEDVRSAAFFRLMLWTAQRGGEVRTMRWEDIDLEAGWWTIPGERTKNKLPHRVPLSPPVVALLRELRQDADGSAWVFPSMRATTGHRETVSRATRRLRAASGVDDWEPHDLRRTAASYMTGMGISRLTVSKLLNHVEQGVTAVYDRHSYDQEKQKALKAWARQLDAIVTGKPTEKVVELRPA